MAHRPVQLRVVALFTVTSLGARSRSLTPLLEQFTLFEKGPDECRSPPQPKSLARPTLEQGDPGLIDEADARQVQDQTFGFLEQLRPFLRQKVHTLLGEPAIHLKHHLLGSLGLYLESQNPGLLRTVLPMQLVCPTEKQPPEKTLTVPGG